METIPNYSANQLAALADPEFEETKRKLIDLRNDIRSSRAPRDQAQLLGPTNALLDRMKREGARRGRAFWEESA